MGRSSAIAAIFLVGMSLGACAETAAKSENVQTRHPAVATFFQIRTHLANGDIASAARLSSDPAAFTARYTRSMQRQGQAKFQAAMRRTLSEVNFHSIRHSGDYSVLVLNLPANRFSSVGAVFLKRGGAGQYLELTTPDRSVPCALLDHYYAVKGEPDAEYACR